MKFMGKSSVVVATFEQEHLADIAHAKLVAAGIRAEVTDHIGFSWNPFASSPAAKFSILVPGKSVRKAKHILGVQTRY